MVSHSLNYIQQVLEFGNATAQAQEAQVYYQHCMHPPLPTGQLGSLHSQTSGKGRERGHGCSLHAPPDHSRACTPLQAAPERCWSAPKNHCWLSGGSQWLMAVTRDRQYTQAI